MFSPSESDPPISIRPDHFRRSRGVTPIGEADVEITDDLAQLIFSVEGVVTGIDLVEIKNLPRRISVHRLSGNIRHLRWLTISDFPTLTSRW